MVSPWKVILATMIIFGCGVVMGGLLVKSALPAPSAPAIEPVRVAGTNDPPPPFAQIQRPEFLSRMKKTLKLTPAQSDEITRIMKESQERSRALWKQISPQMHDELRQVRQEVRQVLTPEQREQLDELLKPRGRRADGPGGGSNRTVRPLPVPDAALRTNSP